MTPSSLRFFRNFSHDVRMYLLTSALVGLTYFGVLTVLLNLYLLRLGHGTQFIGLANGSTALAFALFSVPAGALGNRVGSRRPVIAGVTLLALSTTLLPLAEFLPTGWAEIGVVVTRIMGGMGFALYQVNSMPYLIVATTPEERNQVFSLQVAMPPVIGFVGNLVGGLLPTLFANRLGLSLDDPAPYRYPLILAGLAIAPAIWAQWSTREIAPRLATAANRVKEMAPWLLIAMLALTAMLRVSGEGASRSFFNVYLDKSFGVSTSQIGILTALCQVVAGSAAMLAPFLMARVGKVPTVFSATVGVVGGLLLLAWIPHWLGASLGFMSVVGMLSIANATTSIYQMEAVSPTWRGVTSGVTSMATGLGYASMSLGGGYLIPIIGFRGLFLLGAVTVTLSALLFGTYFRVPRGEYMKV